MALQIGEFASDYIEVRRDYMDWSPLYHRSAGKGEIASDPSPPAAAGNRHGVPDSQLTHNHHPSAAPNGSGTGLPSISEKPETDTTDTGSSSILSEKSVMNANGHANGVTS